MEKKEGGMVTVSVRLPAEVRDAFEEACSGMGLSMASALSVCAYAIAGKRRIPFEIEAGPFGKGKDGKEE